MSPNHIMKAYTFTTTDKQHLTDLLAKSYLLAKIQAYNRAIALTKHVVTIRKTWQPGESDVKHAQQWAAMQVDSIAETYETLLQHAIEQVLEQPHEALGDVIGKIKDVVGKIGDWFKGFLPWKTQQIADQTWNEGADDGTTEFIDNALDGENAYEIVDDGLVQIRVRVEPGTSSSDYCKNYAGSDYSLEAYKSLDISWPAHLNCVHSAEVYTVNARDATESIMNASNITLFLDIDGVFSLMGTEGLHAEKMGNVRAWPIPQASTILQALDQDDRFNPVWVSHWGKDSNLWNYRANIHRWIACFPLVDSDSASKPFAMQHYLDLIDGHGGIWVQDGFADGERQWAVENGVRLLDTTEEPVRSLLLSDSVDVARELIDMLVGSEVSI